MDPVAHTLTGAALGTAGLGRASRLATAALLIGANVPDVDILSAFGSPYETLAFRRGWTHGLLAVAFWPFAVTGALLLWDAWVRRRSGIDAPIAAAPVRAGPLLGVAAVAVASHAALDWLNNYGIRLLMPFDHRWFYGDALFIVDPWVWLVLGGTVFLAYSRRTAALAAWALAWIAASALVLLAPQVPPAARAVWVGGLLAMAAARALGFSPPRHTRAVERTALAAVVLIAVYMSAEALANLPARAEIRSFAANHGLAELQSIMIAPIPAAPFAGSVVIETPSAYHLGRWNWLAHPHFTLDGPALPKLPPSPVLEAASKTPEARRFLTWSRFPYFEVQPTVTGYTVRIRDARYGGTGRLGGPTVHLDRELRPVPSAAGHGPP